MKKSNVLLLFCATAIVAFLAGRGSRPGDEIPGNASLRATALPAPRPGLGPLKPSAAIHAASASLPGQVDAAQAKSLTTRERLALVQKGALIFDGARQAEFLCGLISALTKDELAEATKMLGAAQDRGNYCAQAVWDSIWKQWGKVDAKNCLAGLGRNPQGKPVSDAKNVMKGWMETDPSAAFAWAKEPKENQQEAAAAAHALGLNAGGDIKAFAVVIQSLPADSQTVKACLHDYFDLASVGPGTPDAAAVYQQLPESLKADGWSVTMQRLCYTDPQEAVNWLTEHANEPGRNYQVAARLVQELAAEDPAATAEWAARLPDKDTGPDKGQGHPAVGVYLVWRNKDPVAASAWLQSQNPSTPWVTRLLGISPNQPR